MVCFSIEIVSIGFILRIVGSIHFYINELLRIRRMSWSVWSIIICEICLSIWEMLYDISDICMLLLSEFHFHRENGFHNPHVQNSLCRTYRSKNSTLVVFANSIFLKWQQTQFTNLFSNHFKFTSTKIHKWIHN